MKKDQQKGDADSRPPSTPTQAVTPQFLRALHDDEIAERMRHLATYLRDHTPDAPLDGWLHKDAAFLETYAEVIARAAEPVTPEDARARNAIREFMALHGLNEPMIADVEKIANELGRPGHPQREAIIRLTYAARIALGPAAVSARAPGGRFFIEHGRIHDRITGRHVTTDKDSPFDPGITECCALLNSLAAAPQAETRKCEHACGCVARQAGGLYVCRNCHQGRCAPQAETRSAE